jgi:arylsulfatase A-like enzyme
LRSGKGSLYEGGVRVPLLVVWPGVTTPGSACDEPVCPMDFLPTIAEIVGLPLDGAERTALDGLSFVPLLKNADAKLPREELYFHYPHYYATTTPASAVRARDWKLIEYLEDWRMELYNLKEDLSESVNLADKHRDKVAELRETLHKWREQVGAQMPTR